MKRRIKKKRLLLLIFIVIILISLIIGVICFLTKSKINIIKKDLEINNKYNLSDIVNIKNGSIENKTISFDKLGQNKINITYKNKFKKKIGVEISLNVVDTTKPIIEIEEDEITVEVGSNKEDILKYVNVTDNSLENIDIEIKGDYDLNKTGTYNLTLSAKDSSNNEATKDFTLIVEKKTKSVATNSSSYYVKVNKTLNVAMVYGLDENKEYTKLVKTFVVSTGENTPTGIFTSTDRYETLSLVGGVWGHYTIRIDGAIWFHSVPYFSKPVDGHWNDLEYEEYNKLGTSASLGCIRLAVSDSKWLYDNLPWHTQVEIYESNALPSGVVKPSSITIDTTSENRGWDPTDPDPANPWNF